MNPRTAYDRWTGEVANYLKRSGFSAENLTGGLEKWEAEGLPLALSEEQAG